MFTSFTIGGTTTTITLGPAGIFVVRENTLVQNTLAVTPFDDIPTDTPNSAVARLLSSSVTILPPDSGSPKNAANQTLPINGTASLHVLVASGDAVSPCTTGIDVGTWTITVENGAVASVSKDLNFAGGAIAAMLGNDAKFCLEMRADFPGIIQIDNIQIIFGPSDVSGNTNSNTNDNGSAPITQACCRGNFDEQDCVDVGSDDCFGFGGVPQGEGTACSDTVCAEPFEACCFIEDGSCELLTAEVCSLDGGTPRGSGTDCGNVICAQLTIACCFSNGTCVEQEREDCVAGGGNPQPEGSDCGTTTCTSGACCVTGGGCLQTGAGECAALSGGDYQGDGTGCDLCPADCPADGVCNADCIGDDPDCAGTNCAADGVCNAECPFDNPDPDCVEICEADGFCNENCSDLTPDPDCIADPVGGLKCTVSSNFDNGDDGWLISGDAEGGRGEPDFVATGGNPGGHASADDDVQGGTWFFQAPVKYHGNFAGAYGMTLTFDLKQSSLSSQFDGNDVTLTGGGLKLVFNTASNPGTDWTAYTIPLDEFSSWTVGTLDGATATKTDLQTVLGDLTDLTIRGEFVSGPDTGGLDNVVLNSSICDSP
ncbi:MAG: laminin B domain-containing protein [Phycisphaerae bacterium]